VFKDVDNNVSIGFIKEDSGSFELFKFSSRFPFNSML